MAPVSLTLRHNWKLAEKTSCSPRRPPYSPHPPPITVLNEGAATLSWIGDQAPESGILPALGDSKRYLTIGALNYVASEVHSNFGPLFGPNSDEIKAKAKDNLQKKFEYLNKNLKGGYLAGTDKATIADFYLYIVLSWSGYVGVDYSAFEEVVAYFDKMKSLPNVVSAHEKIATNPATTA